MSNFLRTSFSALALAFVFGAFAATQANAQINDVLKRMDTYYAKLQALRSDIKMIKYNDNLKVTEDGDIYDGKLMFIIKSNLYKDWTTRQAIRDAREELNLILATLPENNGE